MAGNLEGTAAPWKAIADMWNTYFTQPSRVSKGERDRYEEWLSEYARPHKTVLLLGVTPEIRETLARLDCKVTCIDINKEMIAAMDSVMRIRNPRERIKIIVTGIAFSVDINIDAQPVRLRLSRGDYTVSDEVYRIAGCAVGAF